jgi:hypothetical protein
MPLLALLCAMLHATPPQHDESITVSRALVSVRVNDMGQKPVPGLAASDFAATIDGKAAHVLSARWVDSEEEEVNEAAGGRLFVLFIQTDFARTYRRTAGQMAFRRYAEQMIAALNPEDRVAVFSFDSHLKFRRDFTTPEDASQAIAEALRIDQPAAPAEPEGVALTPHLDRAEMKRTWSAEASLLVIGEALQQIDGPKTMIFLGWGLDSENIGTLVQQWPKGVIALQAAEVTMYAFNYAGSMSSDSARLLGRTAGETGGFQINAASLPQQSVDRFVSASVGHYELELRVPPEIARGEHTLQVRVPKRNVNVLAPGTLFTN